MAENCRVLSDQSTVQPATDEEMEHYLWFPDMYCKGCEGGYGPLCMDCLNALAEGQG